MRKDAIAFGLISDISFKTIWVNKKVELDSLCTSGLSEFQLTVDSTPRLSGLRVAQRFSASRKLVQQGRYPFTKGHGIGPK